MRSSRDIASSLSALAAAVVLNRRTRTQEPKAQAAAGAPPAPVVAQKVEAQDVALQRAEAEVASAAARHAHFAEERRSLASAQSSLFHALGGAWRPDADRLGALGRADRVWPTQSL